MIKFVNYYVAFQEVPDEVSLIFTISGCPYRCKGCHSPWLQDDDGHEFSRETKSWVKVIKRYSPYITCICFMGGDGRYNEIDDLISFINEEFPSLKICFYSGNEQIYNFKNKPDYYKTGSFQEDKGGLNCLTTNQKMFKLNQEKVYEDITTLFLKKHCG